MMIDYGVFIREVRGELGMSRMRFAVEFGVSPYTVRSWELCKRTPSPQSLKAIEYRTGRTPGDNANV